MLIYTDEGWSPYLSVDDAQKLDDIKEALRKTTCGKLLVTHALIR